jgi:hypothetical protein
MKTTLEVFEEEEMKLVLLLHVRCVLCMSGKLQMIRVKLSVVQANQSE